MYPISPLSYVAQHRCFDRPWPNRLYSMTSSFSFFSQNLHQIRKLIDESAVKQMNSILSDSYRAYPQVQCWHRFFKHGTRASFRTEVARWNVKCTPFTPHSEVESKTSLVLLQALWHCSILNISSMWVQHVLYNQIKKLGLGCRKRER